MLAEIDPACTEEVLTERLTFRVLCRKEFLDDLRDLAVSSCGQNLDDLDTPSHCAVDENGNYCSETDIYSTEYTASINCADTSVCDPLCIETLTNITNMFGCCFISEFNSTSSGSSPRSYLGYEFWERCGLTSPGFCDLKIDNSSLRISHIDTMATTTAAAAVFLQMSVIAVLFATVITLIVNF